MQSLGLRLYVTSVGLLTVSLRYSKHYCQLVNWIICYYLYIATIQSGHCALFSISLSHG